MKESGEKRLLAARIILLLLLIFWMGVIFFLSGQKAEASDAASGRVVRFLENLFFPDWKALPEAEYLGHLYNLTYLTRKMAHFTEYMILGGLTAGFLLTLKIRQFCRLLWSFLAGTIYAVSDEIHQSFVAGRAPAAFDVCIDSAGVFIGTVLVLGIAAMCLLDHMRKKKVNGFTAASK